MAVRIAEESRFQRLSSAEAYSEASKAIISLPFQAAG
jgi:hypothetical protein